MSAKKLVDAFMQFPQGPKSPYLITLSRPSTGSVLRRVKWFPEERIAWSVDTSTRTERKEGWLVHFEQIDKKVANEFQANEIDWYLYMNQGKPLYKQ